MWRMSLLTRAAATVAATAVVLAPSAFSAAHAETVPLPSADPFYQTSFTNLGSFSAGAVLGSRAVGLTLNDSSGKTFAANGTQLVYRTQDELGHDSETVTTVVRPAGVSRGVVAYLSFYDGLGASCDPSYTLRGATPGQEKYVVGKLVADGYTVTIPDFEGEKLDWAAGHEAGWSTLDAVRATERDLGLPASTPVGLMGYSGGSIAGDWASELAPSYAAELNLVGTSIGGVPANLGDVLNYVDGPTDTNRDAWAGVIPAALVSLGRAYNEDFTPYLSTTGTYDTSVTTKPRGVISGQQIASEVDDECIGDFAASYPGLKLDQLIDPAHASEAAQRINEIASKLVMGTAGTPKMPMLIMQGRSSDGIGDGVMVADDVKALAAKYQAAGTPVQYTELAGSNHTQTGLIWTLASMNFLAQRMPVPPAPAPAKTVVHAKLHGHSKGGKDVLTVTAKGAPKGTKVKLFAKGHKKPVGHGKVNKHGKATITVTDHNGRAKTRYHATVAATATTTGDTTKVLRLR